MSNVNSDNFRSLEEAEDDRASALKWWDDLHNDECGFDGEPVDLHPCPVVSDGLCPSITCEGCKMPEALNKKREEWQIV